jgi:DHA2 family multidrug resistance protein-like MFS transporter
MAKAALEGVPSEARRAARDTLGGAAAAAAQLPGRLGQDLLETARGAFAHALQTTVAICAVISAVAAVLAVAMLRGVRTGTEVERQHGPASDTLAVPGTCCD